MLNTLYKHERLTEILRKEISKKEFSNSRFHTVKYLMNHFKVSQATLNRALQPLFQEGLLYSVSGKGTFVVGKNHKDIELTDDFCNVSLLVSDNDIFEQQFNPQNWFVIRDIVQGVILETQKLNYHMNVCPFKTNLDIFKRLAHKSNSIFIFAEYKLHEPLIQYCIQAGIPYSVYCEHEENKRNINQVWVDVNAGISQITKHLIDKGHQNIAFLGDYSGSPRHQGYKRALRMAGIRQKKKYCFFEMSGDVDSACEISKKIIKSFSEVTAIVCSSDLRAVGAVNVALALHKEIPTFAVTGIDNINDFYPVPMKLTTMEFPRINVGRKLLQIANEYKTNKTVQKVKLETKIIYGSTS